MRHRRRIVWIAAGVSICLLGGLWYRMTQMPTYEGVADLRDSSSVSIVLTEEGFKPQYARIKPGTIVTFTTTRKHTFWPASNPHPQHTLYPELDPHEPVPAGGSWSFVMNRPGLWGYHDHVRSYYVGGLYVE